jgi:hypothetical protein
MFKTCILPTFQSSLDIIFILKVSGLSPLLGFCDDTQSPGDVLLTAKSVYSLCHAWNYCGIKLTGKTNVPLDKPGVVPLRPPQIHHGLIRDWTLSSAVRCGELTATARTSKSNGHNVCFVFGGTGSKDSVPKEKQKVNMPTEILGGYGEQVYWYRFA